VLRGQKADCRWPFPIIPIGNLRSASGDVYYLVGEGEGLELTTSFFSRFHSSKPPSKAAAFV
jgi:hypothetical protein